MGVVDRAGWVVERVRRERREAWAALILSRSERWVGSVNCGEEAESVEVVLVGAGVSVDCGGSAEGAGSV